MGKRLEPAPIWMEITCGNCGCMEGLEYHGQKSIDRLKNATRLWRYDNELGVTLCQECLMKIHNKGGV